MQAPPFGQARILQARERGRRCLEGRELRPRAGSEVGAMSLWYLAQVKTRWVAVRNPLRTAPTLDGGCLSEKLSASLEPRSLETR